MKEEKASMTTATLFDENKTSDTIDMVAIERELRLRQENLQDERSKLERAKHVSSEVMKLKVSI